MPTGAVLRNDTIGVWKVFRKPVKFLLATLSRWDLVRLSANPF